MNGKIFNVVSQSLQKLCDVPANAITPETKIVEDLYLESVDFVDFIFDLEEALNLKVNIVEMNVKLSNGGTKRFRELKVRDICDYLESL